MLCLFRFLQKHLTSHSQGGYSLSEEQFTDNMSVILSHNEPGMLVDTLRNDKDWRKCVFGRKSVDNRQVAAFFLQLIANEILAFRLVSKQPKIVLARDPQDEYVYESVVKWEGFDFRYPRRGSGHSFEEFVRYPTFEALKMSTFNCSDCQKLDR